MTSTSTSSSISQLQAAIYSIFFMLFRRLSQMKSRCYLTLLIPVNGKCDKTFGSVLDWETDG